MIASEGLTRVVNVSMLFMTILGVVTTIFLDITQSIVYMGLMFTWIVFLRWFKLPGLTSIGVAFLLFLASFIFQIGGYAVYEGFVLWSFVFLAIGVIHLMFEKI